MRSVFTGARTVVGAGLSAAAVLCGGLSAVSAHAATAGTQNGPIYYHTFQSLSWQGTLYAVNPDGSGRHAVTLSGTGYDPIASAMGRVQLSPDGSKLAFEAKDGRIFEANADGTDTHALTALAPKDPKSGVAQWTDSGPAWSPDGNIVYFSRQDNTAKPVTTAIETVWADSTPGSETPSHGMQGTDISIASNGLMASLQTSSLGSYELITDASTGKPLGQFSASDFGEMASAVLSPDGSQVAVVKYSGPADPKTGVRPTDLFVASLPNWSAMTQVTKLGNVTPWVAPSWSPDGTKIAYATGDLNAPIDGQASPMDLHVQAPTADATASTVTTDAINSFTWQNGALIPVPTPPSGTPTATRLGGADRIDTAIAVADAAYGPQNKSLNKAKVAVLSRADNYADALSGNALAAQKGGPLLLTGTSGLDKRVAAELQKILAPGSTVYVLGGDSALSPQVAKDLAKLNYTVSRLAGPTRFDTSVEVAKAVSAHPHTVMVATGLNAPDALAAGAAAAQDPAGGVVLLSQDGVLPAATKAYLAGLNPAASAVYGVGRQGVAALKTLPALAAHATALAGDDRYLTDLAVASNTTLFPKPTAAGLATGRTWPDALSGGAYIATLHGPLLLTDGPTVPVSIAAWAKAHGAALTALEVFGGVNAVPYNAARSVAVDAWGPTAWVNQLP